MLVSLSALMGNRGVWPVGTRATSLAEVSRTARIDSAEYLAACEVITTLGSLKIGLSSGIQAARLAGSSLGPSRPVAASVPSVRVQ